MTSRELYEGVQIELNKENAPNILLEDFNYFANKAINQYINKRYNIYDVNQQTTDDLRVLKATATLTPIKVENTYDGLTLTEGGMATYYVDLPSDYLHLLNCICIYNVQKTYKCYNKGDTWRAAATRLTADAYSQVLDNFWHKPTYRRPYYYIHNINTNYDQNNYPRNPSNPYDGNGNGTDSTVSDKDYGTDGTGNIIVQGNGNPRTITIGERVVSNVERGQSLRYGNVSKVRLEIRYGTDTSVFTLDQVENGKGGKIYIDYIKTPQHIRLTQKELDYTEDLSQMMEFPDYVCQEILNELVHIIMENISDQRLQTHPVVSQSIANPAQAQTPEAAGQSAQ